MKMARLPSQARFSRALPILCGSIFAAFLAPRVSLADVLDQYNFGPNGTTPGVLTPTTVGLHLTATSITADPGLLLDLSNPATQPTTTPYLRTTFPAVTATQAAAFTSNADFKFTLTADTGYLLNLTALDFDAMRGGAGTPRGYAVRSSVDNFASVLGTADLATVRPTFTHVSLSLAGATFQNLSTITFKIFSYSPATGSSVDYDSILVSGTTATIPLGGYIWKGNVNGNWDTTAANWTGTGTTYVDNTLTSDVVFDDTAATGAVTVTPSSVSPHSMIVSNSTAAYTFAGSAVSVATNLTKSGNGLMTISNAMSAASTSLGGGGVTVSGGGSLTIASDGSLGASSGLTAGGAVNFNNAAQSLAALAGANTGVVTLNGTVLNVTGASNYNGRITGGGSLVKSNSGTLVLSGTTNDFGGGTTITGGALQLTGAAAAGTGGIAVNAGGTLALGANIGNAVTLNGGTIGVSAAVTAPGGLIVNSGSTVTTFNPLGVARAFCE